MKKIALIGIVGLMLTSCSKQNVQSVDYVVGIDSTSTAYEDPNSPGVFFVNYDTITAHVEVVDGKITVSRVDNVFHSQKPVM